MARHKTVFLDWSGTLSCSRFWGQLARPDHPRNDWFGRIENSLFKNLKSEICPWMRGKYTSEEMCEMIAEDTGFDYETILGDFVEGCRKMELSSPGLLVVIKEIRTKGVHCVVATDNMDSFLRWTVPAMRLADFFDGLLISSELKCLKADVENGASKFFAKYLEEQGHGFKDCALLDDSPDDLGVFSSLGMNYIQIFSPGDLLEKLEKINRLI